MRVLLLQPEDSPEKGPWSRQHWDLVVDLAKSSAFAAERIARQYGCPVVGGESLRQGIADANRVREIFLVGRGALVDDEGIDWWDLLSVLVSSDVLSVLGLLPISKQISPSAELWATRSGGMASLLSNILNRSPQIFKSGRGARPVAKARHLAGLVQRFSPAQIRQIFLDKYDAGYRWRSRFSGRRGKLKEPAVLLPSAYENVSRMANAYARLLPEQAFLLVATRQSAKKFSAEPNVVVRDLGAYADSVPKDNEVNSLMEKWTRLKDELQSAAEFRVLAKAGSLNTFPSWIRNGLQVRNAWREVLQREPVAGVLCGDDSNPATVLPVLLARKRQIPTLDFHHGAFDGLCLLKDVRSDLYLAKNEMERDYLLKICGLPAERVVIGAPSPMQARSTAGRKGETGQSIVFFSEPYDVAGTRAEQVYREVVPRLCSIARESGHEVIVKLHPFESLTERKKILRDILDAADRKLVTVVDGPLTPELMAQAWCGVTVESTAVVDCLQSGVCCFLCGWLARCPYDYVQQYARFGVGEFLREPQQLSEIPKRVVEFRSRPAPKVSLAETVDPTAMRGWLTRAADHSVA